MTSLPPRAGAPLRRRGALLHLAGMYVPSPLSGWLRDREALAALAIEPNPWAS